MGRRVMKGVPRIIPILGCAACILCCIVISVVVGTTNAKYTYGKQTDRMIGVSDFYFESDLLGETTTEYILNESATTFSFVLKNHADELRYTADDIAYTVAVSERAKGADGAYTTVGSTAVSIADERGTLAGGDVSDVQITLSGLEKGKTYTVTVTGESFFTKTLSARITVNGDSENAYQHLDGDNAAYVLLTVWTEKISGTLSIIVPDGLIPDNTWAGMETWKTTEKTHEITAEEYSSYTFRFFKTEQYQNNSFTVRLNGGDIAESEIG